MPDYTVKQGDCLSSIAHRYGLFWENVWNHPKNLNLKEKRKDPNVLFSGDVVFIPDKEEKQEPGATEQHHRFRRKGVPARLRVVFMSLNKPRANEPYILNLDGILSTGNLNKRGLLNVPISPSARQAIILVGEEEKEYRLELGGTDPVTETRGIQQRLNHLGFACGPVDGKFGPKTRRALRSFQEKHSLRASGDPDEATLSKLREIHGS
jgi:hypothetical protein